MNRAECWEIGVVWCGVVWCGVVWCACSCAASRAVSALLSACWSCLILVLASSPLSLSSCSAAAKYARSCSLLSCSFSKASSFEAVQLCMLSARLCSHSLHAAALQDHTCVIRLLCILVHERCVCARACA